MWLDYTIDDVFDDFCFYSRKQLTWSSRLYKTMDLFRHKIQFSSIFCSGPPCISCGAHSHILGGVTVPALWYFPLSRRSPFLTSMAPVCSSCFWLNQNHIWPTSKNTSFANKKINANTKPYHAFGTNFPANSLPTMVGLVERWKLISLIDSQSKLVYQQWCVCWLVFDNLFKSPRCKTPLSWAVQYMNT